MDALALLCNLHADGPATLARLRRAGFAQLADLERAAELELAELLRQPVARAARFQREARLLGERLGAEPVEEEGEPHSAPVARPAPAAPAAPSAAPVLAVSAAASASALASAAAAESRRDRLALEPVKEAVLEVWRERDRIDPPTCESLGVSALEERGERLRPGRIDGLDAEALAALERAGVRTLAQLLAADPVVLARASGLGFTRIRRWHWCLQRASAALPPASDAGSASGAGGGAGALGAGGPFS